MSKSKPVAREVVEQDIDFSTILDLVRTVSRRDAAGLLHSTLKVAFNNGEAFGMESMAATYDNALSKFEGRSP